ncbi:MAG: 3-deoxy-D-manno-octulosonic acid transferase, partial [Burkholderiaceae bacterium]
SREGEEARFMDALHAAQGANVQWLIVPRHPQRFDEVAALVQRHGFSVSRRSAWAGAPEPADVWIGDSLAEMPLYYGMADVALLGGSFEAFGGQNLIEAAACGCPVVMGPSTFNFAEAAELAQEAGAAERVGSMEEGLRRAVGIACDTGMHSRHAEAALAFAGAHRGAAGKTADAIVAIMESVGLKAHRP